MIETPTATLEAMDNVRAGLAKLSPDDREGLIPIGAELERLIGELRDDSNSARTLLEMLLEGLQSLYVGETDHPEAAIKAMRGAADAAFDALSPDGSSATDRSADARKALATALGREDDEPELDEESADTYDLNDVALMLMGIDREDMAQVVRLGDALQSMLANEALSVPTRDHLAAAMEAVFKVVHVETDDPDGTLAMAGERIEAANLAQEEADMMAKTARRAANSAKAAETVAAPPVPVAPEPEAQVSDDPEPADLQEAFLPQDADPTLLGEFITECRELVEGAEASLLAMETDPDDLEAINTVFRAFHTIKGTSGFLGIVKMAELAHKAESLLSRMRDNEIRCTGGYADLALRSVDMLKELIQMVQDGLGGEPLELPSGFRSLIRVLSNPEAAGVGPDSGGPPTPAAPPSDVPSNVAPATAVESEAVQQNGAAAVTDQYKDMRSQQRAKSPEHGEDTSVRVRTDRLDKLIEMVGELVIAQAMVAQDPAVVVGTQHELVRKVGHAGKIVRELQDLSMSMRMVPLKASFQKMARLVRDLARKSGKEVEFVTGGEETEIDRNMVDAVADPLVHMIRNAVDHGIEPPEARVAAGKSPKGTVCLSASHSGGNVVVEIRDDGKGLSRDRIVEKAIAKGLIETDKAMSDSDVFELIFAPGFSTVDNVTEFSGRGVGMDVVRKSIESLRGTVEISSTLGHGSTFTLRLPLTLAITDGMLIRVGADRYVIPTISIHLSFRPEASALSTVAGRGELVLLRGELMPVFRLHRLFNIPDAIDDPTKGLLVVVGSEDRRCALLVDELLGQQQVVAKTLGDGIGKVQGVTGGAILGDGRVGLIVDTAELVALARQSSNGR